MVPAIVAAFGMNAPVAEKGLRAATCRKLVEIENKGRRAYARSATPRGSLPRSLRVPLKSRTRGSEVVSDAVLSVLLGEEPMAGKYGASLVLDELAPEATQHMASDQFRRVEFIVRRVSLAVLRRSAAHVSIERWKEACGWVVTTLEWATAADEFLTLTGGDRAALGITRPLVPLAAMLRRADEQAKYAPGYQVAMIGLVGAAIMWSPRRMRRARETVNAMAAWVPHLRALGRLAADLPERWRPALAAGGPVYMASLPEAEREELARAIGRWRDEHPAWGRRHPTAGGRNGAHSGTVDRLRPIGRSVERKAPALADTSPGRGRDLRRRSRHEARYAFSHPTGSAGTPRLARPHESRALP
ncbi:MAG TPA: hypothetical protein VKR78_03300 [Acidimicrobiales bacterium]|nr:hypothetical protein [Acidimicrobiales bacterium]